MTSVWRDRVRTRKAYTYSREWNTILEDQNRRSSITEKTPRPEGSKGSRRPVVTGDGTGAILAGTLLSPSRVPPPLSQEGRDAGSPESGGRRGMFAFPRGLPSGRRAGMRQIIVLRYSVQTKSPGR